MSVATLVGFFLVDDGRIIKWWLFPQWPVYYRQRGPGADLAKLREVLGCVPVLA